MADGEGSIGRQMAASYVVEITGVERTHRELERLDGAIKSLRSGQYSPVTSVTVASSLGGKDLLVSRLDALEGRVQTATQKAMIEAMDKGKDIQADALRAATTAYGLSGRGKNPGGRNGPGRDDTGNMIKAIKRSVEVLKTASITVITGFHGWSTEGRGYITAQEKGGANGIPAANSLGHAIVPVREFLKKELKGLKR